MQNFDTQLYLRKNGVTSIAFSPCGEYVAVSLRSEPTMEVFKIRDKKAPSAVKSWIPVKQFKEHIMRISEVIWSSTNHILTCSYDKSVWCWRQEGQTFYQLAVNVVKPCSFLTACWLGNGHQFALGGSDHCAYVGYWEQKNNFWNMASIQNNKSSVISVDFHPSGRVIGIGSSDFKFSIITCYFNKKDEKFAEINIEDDNYKGPFASINTVGITLIEINTSGWVEAIAFSPSGNRFVFASHDSSIWLGDVNQDGSLNPKETPYSSQTLPYKKLVFKNESQLVACGYEGDPVLFELGPQAVSYKRDIKETLGQATEKTKSKINEIRDGLMGKKISNNKQEDDQRHKIPVNSLRILPQFSTFVLGSADPNGNVVFWDLA